MSTKKRIRVNVRSVANVKAARQEKRNGRDVIIVPSATLPDDVIMNDIFYPADEIEKSFASLNRTPAPFGHPMINNKFVSASDPEGINHNYVGAWNENVRRESGRVFLDKVIDVDVANRSEQGQELLQAIDKGEPVHTSTGLFCELEAANGDVKYKHTARNIYFDHDAILLNEDGAATPDQGVGMFVNSSGEHEEIEVVNSAIDQAEDSLDWAGMYLLDAVERRHRAGAWERIKSVLMEALSPERETSANRKEADMADEKQLEELSAKVNTLSESMSKIGDTIAEAVQNAVKPLTDNLTEIKANQEAQEAAEKDALVNKVVKANILDEETAKEMTINALKKLAAKVKTDGKAATLNGAFSGAGGADEFDKYDLNAGMEAK